MRHLRPWKRSFFWLSVTAFLITLILFGIYSLRYNQQLRQAQSQYRSLQKKAIQRSPPQTISKKQNYSKKKYQKRTVTIPNIDFPLLWKYNSDIYAWIIIPDTNVSYPILQHSKYDTYYLNHNLNGSTGYPGCIFSKKQSKKDMFPDRESSIPLQADPYFATTLLYFFKILLNLPLILISRDSKFN